MSNALDDIAAERRRQVTEEGWTKAHDDHHTDGSLARAASAYALAGCGDLGGYDGEWPVAWGPLPPVKDQRRSLVIAGALIAAEIERIDRADRAAREA